MCISSIAYIRRNNRAIRAFLKKGILKHISSRSVSEYWFIFKHSNRTIPSIEPFKIGSITRYIGNRLNMLGKIPTTILTITFKLVDYLIFKPEVKTGKNDRSQYHNLKIDTHFN